MVRKGGLEPPRPKALPPQSSRDCAVFEEHSCHHLDISANRDERN